MNKRPTEACALCKNTRPLCDSHLLPKSAYAILRQLNPGLGSPLLMDDDSFCYADKQLKSYLLCEDCEQRFRARGEDWVMANCYRGPSNFRLKRVLEAHGPFGSNQNGQLFAVRDIADVHIHELIYFASSVFWKAGAETWRRSKKPIHIELGKYLEHLRLYLLDESTFPKDMALHVWVSCWDIDAKESRLSAVCHPPQSDRIEGVRSHKFGIPGLSFQLMVGSNIPDKYSVYATSAPLGVIGIIPRLDFADAFSMMDRFDRLKARRGVQPQRG